MAAAWLVVRAEIRRSRWALVGLVVLVALVGGVVTAAAAGARRTSGSLDRFLAETASHDARVESFVLGDLSTADAVERAAEGHPDVEATASGLLYSFASEVETDFDLALLVDPADELFHVIDRPIVLDGRMPGPDAPHEVALNPTASTELAAAVGDRVLVTFFSPEDCRALAEDDFLGFNGAQIDLEVVGIVRQAEDLQGSGLRAGATALGSPAFVAARSADACPVAHGVALDLRDGADIGAIQTAVREAAPDTDPIVVASEASYIATTRSAIDVAVTSLMLFTLVAAVAGVLALAQAVSRQVGTAGEARRALEALGLDRRQRTAVLAAPSIVATIFGLLAAAAISVAASPRFPIGVARDAEPDLGPSFDVVAVLGIAIVLAVLGTGVALLAARAREDARPRTSAGPSMVLAAALRSGAGPATSFGLRLAYERTPDRTATPARTAIAGVLVGTAGVVAVLVLVASLATTRDAPDRWGWTWSSKPNNGGDLSATDARSLLEEPALEAVAVLENGSVAFGEVVLQGNALTDEKGHTAFQVVDGRLPTGPNEVGLGSQALADLEVEIGDEVEAAVPEGTSVPLRVVGETVAPLIDITSPGDGAVFTAEGLRALSPEDGRQRVLTYRPGVDRRRLEQRLSERFGLEFPAGLARPQEPGRLANMADNRNLVLGLGGFFALLGVFGLTHAVVVSARRHRRSFGVLRAIGLSRSQVRGAVVVQAVAIVLAGALVGIPLGVAVGRTAWLAAVSDLGMIDDPTTPPAVVSAVAAAAVASGAVVALVTGWLVARRRPAEALRVE